MTAVAQIESLDTRIFSIDSQTSGGDRSTLLRLQNMARRRMEYAYLELGSHLGGTLLPHLLDPSCRAAYSVDLRPSAQPDERGRSFEYPANSTARMIAALEKIVPPSSMGKLKTFDCASAALSLDDVSELASLVFIDAEHTNRAVFRDFLHLLKLAKPASIIAFHDSNLVFDALCNIETFLSYSGVRHAGLYLPDAVFALLLGDFVDHRPDLAPLAYDEETFIAKARRQLDAEIVESVRSRAL